MQVIDKNIKKELHFGKAIAKDNLPINKEIKDSDDLNWCVASAEVSDYENDIIDINSLSLERHTLEHPTPVLCSHLKKLPDGTFPVIGSVTQWAKGKTIQNGKEVDTLFAGWEWADKENPDLVNKIKPLYPRLVNNFSISFIPDTDNAYKEKDNSIRWKNCIVTELSLTLVGANPHAMALKELSKSLENLLDDNVSNLINKSLEKANQMERKDLEEMMSSYNKSTQELYTNQMQDLVTKNTSSLEKCFADHKSFIEGIHKDITDRFDALEASMSMLDDSDDDQDNDKSNKEEVKKEYDELKKALDNLGKKFIK